MSLGKSLLSSALALTLLIVLGAILIAALFWARLPDTIARHLAKTLKVPVSIEKMGLGWQEIDLYNIQVDNIPQSILKTAISCKKFEVETPFIEYIQKEIVIEEIRMDGVYLGLEFESASGAQGNWTILMKNTQSSLPAQSSPSERSLVIRKLIVTNLQVDVVYRKDGSKIHHLPLIPQMELTNISSKGGLPMDQVMNSVLGEMLKEVFLKQNLKNMFQDFLKQNTPLKDYLSPFQGFFNRLQRDEQIESQQIETT